MISIRGKNWQLHINKCVKKDFQLFKFRPSMLFYIFKFINMSPTYPNKMKPAIMWDFVNSNNTVFQNIIYMITWSIFKIV